ncbi:hypothetical protein [Aeromicrobium sp.]|uniref:hypothetical protein n=1 Tax=Aeromicrobium sp. TaxID=1871063 RepID=UPI0019CD7C6F|nr:hypothetical protein [Aeromicrobium sp.]MBC7631264.1 hypothetical protein [Aeromicrobium sp.]
MRHPARNPGQSGRRPGRVGLALAAAALSTVIGVVAVVGVLPVGASTADSGSAGSTGSPAQRDSARLAGPGAEPTMGARSSNSTGTRTRHVTLEWKGAPKASRYTRRVGIPEIGQLALTCRPNEVQISLRAKERDNETQMWLAKYEDKSYGQAVAVKTVRIYRYANANDNGNGGTSNPQHEGLNQAGGKNGVENYGKGYGHGIISQRQGRNDPVGADPLKPVTTFDINWYWNGFDYPPQYRYCKIDIVLVTKFNHRLGVNWHGDADAEGNVFQQVRIPSLGYLQLRCETGRFGNMLVSLVPDSNKTKVYVETVTGEGRVEDHVDTRNATVDRATGKLGPFPIPNNGIMRFYFDKGSTTVPFMLSSYEKTNDPQGNLNTCEIAMGQFPR